MRTLPRGAVAGLIGLGVLLTTTSPGIPAVFGPSVQNQHQAQQPARSLAELERQVRDTSPRRSTLAAASQSTRAQQLLRCFGVDTETYCLGLGFVDQRPTGAELAATAAQRSSTPTTRTGALTPAQLVAARAAATDTSRVNSELNELRTAWAGREKARTLRTGQYDITRPPPPALNIMGPYATSQERSYWCGPATFQSIDWADDNQRDTQLSWASDLGTTTSGTSITAMVQQTNLKTNWDVNAGTYIVQGVASWTSSKFFATHQTHIGDGTAAPIIEHPQLLRRYFPYLRYDHSGHFQVGRGYSRPAGTITIFEVFNERRFNSSGNVTNGSKNIPAYTMFNATLANAFKNVGL
jgi:hypothetical protein